MFFTILFCGIIWLVVLFHFEKCFSERKFFSCVAERSNDLYAATKSKLNKKEGRIPTIWWLFAVLICISSGFIAVNWPKDDAIREMATSAFGGGVIGLLILLYEQFREDRREKFQLERDKKLAGALQESANREADLRSMADFLLKELKPMHDKYFAHFLHGCPEFKEIRHDFQPLINLFRFYASRVNDSEMSTGYNKYVNSTNRRISYLQKNRGEINKKTEADPAIQQELQKIIYENNVVFNSLIIRSENLLANKD